MLFENKRVHMRPDMHALDPKGFNTPKVEEGAIPLNLQVHGCSRSIHEVEF